MARKALIDISGTTEVIFLIKCVGNLIGTDNKKECFS